jgi:hypothetical protein
MAGDASDGCISPEDLGILSALPIELVVNRRQSMVALEAREVSRNAWQSGIV